MRRSQREKLANLLEDKRRRVSRKGSSPKPETEKVGGNTMTVDPTPPSMAPTRKVSAGLLAGSITTIIFWVSETVFKFSPSADVASAVTAILTFVVSYFVKEKGPE